MEQNAKIGIAGVILVGLGVAVYYQHKKDERLGTPAAAGELPELHVSADVDKVEITNGSKGAVTLEKKGDKWEVTKPVDAVANQTNAKSLIDNMKDLKIEGRAVSNADDDAKKTYELIPDKEVHVVAYKGPDKQIDALFGKSGGLGDSMMIEGKPDIFLVKGYSSWMYGREVKDWRDKEIFKIDEANVVSLEIDNKTGKFVFTKDDKDFSKGTFKGKAIANLDPAKVKNALGAFKDLTANDFGDGKSAADTGLDKPEDTVTIKMKDGATYVLSVGTPADKDHYAQKSGDSQVYTIGSFPYEWATGDLAKFQQPSDAGAPDSGAKDSGAKPAPAAGKDAGKK